MAVSLMASMGQGAFAADIGAEQETSVESTSGDKNEFSIADEASVKVFDSQAIESTL